MLSDVASEVNKKKWHNTLSHNKTETELQSKRTFISAMLYMLLISDAYRLTWSMLFTPSSSSWNKNKQLY